MPSARFYTNSDGSTADMVYDDQAMTASGVLVHVPAGASPVVVDAIIAGQPVSVTYPPGTDVTFAFTQPLPIAFTTTKSGGQGIAMSWLESFSASVSVGG